MNLKINSNNDNSYGIYSGHLNINAGQSYIEGHKLDSLVNIIKGIANLIIGKGSFLTVTDAKTNESHTFIVKKESSTRYFECFKTRTPQNVTLGDTLFGKSISIK